MAAKKKPTPKGKPPAPLRPKIVASDTPASTAYPIKKNIPMPSGYKNNKHKYPFLTMVEDDMFEITQKELTYVRTLIKENNRRMKDEGSELRFFSRALEGGGFGVWLKATE